MILEDVFAFGVMVTLGGVTVVLMLPLPTSARDLVLGFGAKCERNPCFEFTSRPGSSPKRCITRKCGEEEREKVRKRG